MKEVLKAVIGDWVRFQRNGALVIGVVQYETTNGVGDKYLITDHGAVDAEHVLEVRSPAHAKESR